MGAKRRLGQAGKQELTAHLQGFLVFLLVQAGGLSPRKLFWILTLHRVGVCFLLRPKREGREVWHLEPARMKRLIQESFTYSQANISALFTPSTRPVSQAQRVHHYQQVWVNQLPLYSRGFIIATRASPGQNHVTTGPALPTNSIALSCCQGNRSVSV